MYNSKAHAIYKKLEQLKKDKMQKLVIKQNIKSGYRLLSSK